MKTAHFMKTIGLGLLLVAGLLGAVQAQTTEIAGVKLDNSITLANTPLQLNGAGIRTRFFIKVYVAGLYLQGKASTPEQVLKMAGPKRMHVVMLRDIDSTLLGNLLIRGVEDNTSQADFFKFAGSFSRLSNIFNERKKLAAGESFDLDYIPGTGTVVSVNGKPDAQPFKEPEFFAALMRIWLGDKPADADLKRALLGPNKAAPASAPHTKMGDQ